MKNDPTSELKEILSHYDLGELAGQEKNERGFVNTSFAIDVIKEGQPARYFLRKYKRGIKEEEIQFEHSLIEHLVAAGSPPVARLYPTREGKTYYHGLDAPDDREGVFYAIFDYLPGEDRYTWVDPRCNGDELYGSAAILAQFHRAASRLAPKGKRDEPKILELLPVIAQNASGCLQKSKGTPFDDCLAADLPLVLGNIQETLTALSEPEARKLPKVIVHCDFHPGNLKYLGAQVVGLFDFDWSKVDARLFDVGLAAWYFCTGWEGDQDGILRLEEVGTFLKAYQEALRPGLEVDSGVTPSLGPLTPLEGKYLAHMISAGNLYIFNWTIDDFYAKDVDPQEYLVFLRHSLNFCRWFLDPRNRAQLEQLIQRVV